ncbi:hypothetical protein ACMDCR_07605 [Labrys okinawensis]|uniref:hypothetical protein n=1 Tax=Labrys okinawensis TaxID=346911 RepID=UPI0039BD05BF
MMTARGNVMGSLDVEGLNSAKRHFPNRSQDVELLAQESESFRDLCDELVTAEKALATVDQLDEATRAERRLEWLAYIRSALAAIEAELQHVNIIPIERGSRRQS